MNEIKCPKCESKSMHINTFSHELMIEYGKGWTNDLYHCPKCKVNFITRTNFEIEITSYKIEDMDNDF